MKCVSKNNKRENAPKREREREREWCKEERVRMK